MMKLSKILKEVIEKQLIIMVGLPGSGKSTYIKKLNNPFICSADHFFEKGGEYKFDINKAGQAHTECREKCEKGMKDGKPLIVVDNTNVSDKERKPYEELADKYGYSIKYAVFKPNENNLEMLAKRNQHGVTVDILKHMLNKFTIPSGEFGKVKIIRNK